MENALTRVGGRFINRNDFVISVMDEFGIEAPSMQIEKHLKILYSSFRGSEKQKVDCYAILCTYLSVVFKEAIQTNPSKVFNSFCDIYSPENSDSMPAQDVLDILSLGCVAENEYEQCSEKLLSSIKILSPTFKSSRLNHEFVTRKSLSRILDYTPSLIIQFRETILQNLNGEKRLALLDLNEVCNTSLFETKRS